MKSTFVKLILISGAAIGATGGTALMAQTPDQPAQQQQQPQHRAANPQQQLNRLTKKLALTADQQNQLLPILTSRDEQVSTIENDTTLTPKERHAKLLAVRADANSRLRNVLTDTQRAAYDQMIQEERDRAKARKQSSVSN